MLNHQTLDVEKLVLKVPYQIIELRIPLFLDILLQSSLNNEERKDVIALKKH